MAQIGRNVETTISKDGKTLTLVIDLTATGEPSASGKTLVFATTGGNQQIAQDGNGRPIYLGLNVYRKK
jgi:hypothetical protein